MLSGADIRRYRKAIKWNQTAFAKAVGLAQPTLSLLEAGRIAVSEDHLARLSESFNKLHLKPRFSEFVASLEAERATGQAALRMSEGKYLTLAVWRWQEGFDLSHVPSPEQAVNLVTVRATEQPILAFEMGKATERWDKGDILVFTGCRLEDIEDGHLCLVQVKRPRARGTQTLIATSRVVRATHGRAIQFQPLSPPAPAFSTETQVPESTLRLAYRGSYTHLGKGIQFS